MPITHEDIVAARAAGLFDDLLDAAQEEPLAEIARLRREAGDRDDDLDRLEARVNRMDERQADDDAYARLYTMYQEFQNRMIQTWRDMCAEYLEEHPPQAVENVEAPIPMTPRARYADLFAGQNVVQGAGQWLATPPLFRGPIEVEDIGDE